MRSKNDAMARVSKPAPLSICRPMRSASRSKSRVIGQLRRHHGGLTGDHRGLRDLRTATRRQHGNDE
jgi:hypothetical protein